MNASVAISRPVRWDHPLDPEMSPQIVKWLLTQPPFDKLDSAAFSGLAPLSEILKNDSRLHKLASADVLFQKGQYGGSAYLMLRGTMRMFLSDDLAASQSGIQKTSQRSGSSWLAWFNKQTATNHDQPQFGLHDRGSAARVFLQDVPGVLDRYDSTTATSGELFGEQAAITRSAREFTAVAETDCLVLEIRWQGLKLLRQSNEFRALLDQRYRSRILKDHLRETPALAHIPPAELDHVVQAARLESFGELEWYADFRQADHVSPSDRIAREPLIAEENSYAVGLWIIRSGFARLSRRQGAGHRTLAYLGKGQLFGLNELAYNWQQEEARDTLPYQTSLRAIGYLDAICIPKAIVDEHILPYVPSRLWPAKMDSPFYRFGQPVLDVSPHSQNTQVDIGLLEFLVEQRLINGRSTMVIDTNRCTRCDDCVKACATLHGDQPLFERRGVQYGQWLFAQACMHCEDPVCMIGCPTGAIHRHEKSGQVQINPSSCIGCKSCAESCPYENIRMIETVDSDGRKQVDKFGLPILQASKCDHCEGSKGRPACQTACPHDALMRLDLRDLEGVQTWLQSKAG